MSPSHDGDDEVLTPEIVDGGGPQPRALPPDGTPVGARPSRGPFWTMTAGIGSLFMFFFFLPLSPVLAAIGIIKGRRLLRELDPNDHADHQARRQAKIGLVGGITGVVILLAWIAYMTLTYEPPDKGTEDLGDDKATSEPAG